MGLTKMLATKRSPWRRAVSMRLTWPACRFPMVGTNTTRSPARRQARTRSRTAPMVVTVSKDRARGGTARTAASETVLGRRVLALLHGAHVALERLEVVAGALHEVAHEARLAPGGDVEHVVGHEDLTVGVGAGTDADHRYMELRRDGLAEGGGNAFEQHDVGAGGLEAPRLLEQPRRGLALAPLDPETAGLVNRLGLESHVRA